MRNLKRALSLALASVMLVGMMVVGTSAASYPDVDSNDNVEAIAVLQAVGVMQGDADTGEFRPDDEVSRNEMAVIMARLLLGPDADNYVGTHPFTDVPSWADKYVAACYNEGIIMGMDDTTYGGKDTVTAQQAAAMMLRALGYEKLEGTGADWARPVVAKANQIRLFADVGSNPTAAMTRNQIAQLGLNTLEATMVTSDVEQDIVVEGVVTIPGKVTYTEREVDVKTGDTKSTNSAIAIDGEAPASGTAKVTLQLGEWLYDGDLKKETTGVGNDDFKRPNDYKWTTKDNDDVYTVPKSATITFTAETSEDDVLKAIKGYTFGAAGEVTNKTSNAAGTATLGDLSLATSSSVVAQVKAATGNGKLVEIYATDKTVNTVVIVSYTVGKVTNITTNSKGNVTYTINGTQKIDYADDTKDTIVLAAPVEKDDIVLFTDEGTNPVVRYVYPLDSFTGKMTRYSTANKTMTVDGTVYTTGAAGMGTSGLTAAASFTGTDESVFYVDQYGYIVAVDGINEDTKYAVIDSIAAVNGSGVEGSGYVEARLVFQDGTTEIVRVATGLDKWIITAGTDLSAYDDASGSGGSALVSSAVADTAYTGYLTSGDSTTAVNFYCVGDDAGTNDTYVGSIVKYSVSDNKYTLTDEGSKTAGTATFTKGNPTIGTLSEVANNDTVYVVKTKSGDDDVWTVYTGYRNMPSSTGTIKADVAKDNGDVVLVYVDATAAGASVGSTSSEVVFFFDNKFEADRSDPDKTLYIYNAVRGGEIVEVVATKDLSVDDNKLYKVTLNDDDQVTDVAAASAADYVSVTANGETPASKGVLTIDTSNNFNGNSGHNITSLVYNDDSTIYYVDVDNDSVTISNTMDDVKDNAVIYVKTVEKSATSADGITVDVAYVLVTDEEPAPADLSVSTQPVSKKYFQGTTFNASNALSVAATGGTAGYTYQWQKSTTDTQDASFSDIAGATGTTLTLTDAAAPATTGNTHYRCKITDSDSATVTSNAATIEVKSCTISWPSDSAEAGETAATKKNVTVTCGASAEIKIKSEKKDGIATGTMLSEKTVNTGDSQEVYAVTSKDNGTITVTVTVTETGYETLTATKEIKVICDDKD